MITKLEKERLNLKMKNRREYSCTFRYFLAKYYMKYYINIWSDIYYNYITMCVIYSLHRVKNSRNILRLVIINIIELIN